MLDVKFTAFFDTARVRAALDAATIQAQSKFGAYVARRARSSMRRRKKASAPGSPPSAHSEDSYATLKNIRFGYDFRTRSTVVGPVLLGRKHGVSVPALHEFGGTAAVREVRWPGGKWVLASAVDHVYPKMERRLRAAAYPARPFMAPALKAEAPKFPSFFAASLRAA